MTTTKFNKVLNLVECLGIINKRKLLKNKNLFLEYNVSDTAVNRKFLEVQVKVILGFYDKYISGPLDDEEEIFMHMYTNTDIMKIFRDEYGELPDKIVKKWNKKDINKLITDLKPKVTIK